jgi:hypothetical protein
MLKTGTVVHYGEDLLILRLRTATPNTLHAQIMKGITVAQKMAFLADDVTKEDKDALLALNEVMSQILPSESALEKALS